MRGQEESGLGVRAALVPSMTYIVWPDLISAFASSTSASAGLLSATSSLSASLSPTQTFAMAEPPAPPPSKDTLGLDLDSLKITEDTPAPAPPPDAAAADQEQPAATPITPSQSQQSDVTAGGTPARERKKPYINPERVKTGGAQRVCIGPQSNVHFADQIQQDKLTDEELAERMVRIREQNEKIKQRRAVGIASPS